MTRNVTCIVPCTVHFTVLRMFLCINTQIKQLLHLACQFDSKTHVSYSKEGMVRRIYRDMKDNGPHGMFLNHSAFFSKMYIYIYIYISVIRLAKNEFALNRNSINRTNTGKKYGTQFAQITRIRIIFIITKSSSVHALTCK